MNSGRVFRSQVARLTGLVLLAGFVGGCDETLGLSNEKPSTGTEDAIADERQNTTELVERDVEAPEVFQVTEAGLWDGRPSLGGIWVAHPDVTNPERVIIRNTSNNKFVIGALFRREREVPGPRLQASSDAAAALGMLAGAPVQLNVTALRREEIEEAPVVVAEDALVETPAEVASVAAAVPANEEIKETALDPIASAAAAIDAAAPAPAPLEPAPANNAAKKPSLLGLDKPYVQVGIFGVEENANRVADRMRSAGMLPTIDSQSANGKPFWRVLVGPAQNRTERNTLLKQIKAEGFSDAYPVKK